jgi:AraC-like DNA-binding protein
VQILVNLASNYLTECGDSADITERLPRAILVGPRGRYEVIDTRDMAELAGLVIEPGGFAGFCRERSDVFFEKSAALDAVWRPPDLIERLQEAEDPAEKLRVLDLLLQERVARAAGPSKLVSEALSVLEVPGVNVATCARSAGLSERRFSQLFREDVGVGPKLWCHIQRFQRATSNLHNGLEVRWAELALECGYYDQAHFANDFRAFSGINPTTYYMRRGRWQNHIPL